MNQVKDKIDIRKLDLPMLEKYITEQLGEPRFRSKQIWKWLWQKRASTFVEMTDLSAVLREKLPEIFSINPIVLDKIQRSQDGTIKSRFRLYDGHLIESVLIPVPSDNRYTVCVSCQVGCSLSCKFCATGQMKRVRNLDPGEIFDQVFLVNQQCLESFDRPLTNIVYMGMGEPLLAYQPVIQSIERITAPDGLNMSPRRITVSTAGIAKMIRKMADDQVKFNLALSLHAADDEKRNEIMPINEQNNLEVLQQALVYFYQNTHNKITLEYIAFQNFNDGIADADNLARFCKAFPVVVNIIEYNPISGFDKVKSSADRIDTFARRLSSLGVSVTVRRSRGKDIDAACGQLANKG
ncbi:MAG: 23S rRNA (adenine(2503)-C(2))-methyltransferase RlmN [Saprospiraceae bacterium]|nr:23S rRNA (adenine(2503)-C(2))-methyltransferase RlmN [Saprospiraceae bacterium]